jgi:ribonuclease BN (tRNA processing enzyme)
MNVVLLGSGGYIPTSERQTSCLLLPDVGVVLDAGTGMSRLGRYLQTSRLDVFLSHVHLDHVAGLTYLINVVPAEVVQRTTVHCEADKLAAVQEHLFAELIFPVAPTFRFQPLRERYELAGGGVLSHFKLDHPGGSVGFRLDWPGHSMAYVTDTTADTTADYVERIRGVDLLIHEAYFADESGNLPRITGHSSLPAVAELAGSAGVGRLVLVHIDPKPLSDESTPTFDLPAARRIFERTELGFDGQKIEF